MIFVDSGVWIALMNQDDGLHDDTVAIYNDLVQQDAQFLTTNVIIYRSHQLCSLSEA